MIAPPRYCSIENCKTGRYAEIKKRKKLGLRHLSVFRVPKDINLREKWSNILGQTLAVGVSVCELHFSIDDIVKYEEIPLPNGLLQRIHKERYFLRPKALPIREKRKPEEENVISTSNVVPTYIKLEIEGSHSFIVLDPNPKENQLKSNCVDLKTEFLNLSEINIALHETIGLSSDDITNSDPTCKLNNSCRNDACNEANSSVNIFDKSIRSYSQTETNKKVQRVDIEFPIIQTKPQYDHCYHLKSYEHQDNITEYDSDERKLDSIDNALVSQTNQAQHCKSSTMKIEFENVTEISPLEVPQTFNLNKIRDYFIKNPLPKSWTWIENKKFDGIIFVQINKNSQQIRCYVECKEDLSIEVSTFDKCKLSDLNNVVTSIDDILNLLMKVYNLRFCEGGIEKRSENCSFILNEQEVYKKKMPVDRCANCRNEKKSKSNRCNETKIKTDVKRRETLQKLYQANKASEYYREKSRHLKEMLQNMKKMCVTLQNTAKKETLDEAINQLPNLQQEVVRTCFSCVDIDPKQRKYEPNFAYECFLLRLVSNAAYEHMKQRNWLPLPCKNTLDSIIGGGSKT